MPKQDIEKPSMSGWIVETHNLADLNYIADLEQRIDELEQEIKILTDEIERLRDERRYG